MNLISRESLTVKSLGRYTFTFAAPSGQAYVDAIDARTFYLCLKLQPSCVIVATVATTQYDQ